VCRLLFVHIFSICYLSSPRHDFWPLSILVFSSLFRAHLQVFADILPFTIGGFLALVFSDRYPFLSCCLPSRSEFLVFLPIRFLEHRFLYFTLKPSAPLLALNRRMSGFYCSPSRPTRRAASRLFFPGFRSAIHKGSSLVFAFSYALLIERPGRPFLR